MKPFAAKTPAANTSRNCGGPTAQFARAATPEVAYYLEDYAKYECSSCGYQFSVKAGTIFHDSHLPLWKWFLAVYMMVESKKGVSANQIKRMIGVSYKTAWYLCHRIRAAVGNACNEPLGGVVEADETFVGGKERGIGSGNKGRKAVVAGAVERDGEVRLKVIPDRTRQALHAFLDKAIERGDTEVMYTDEWDRLRIHPPGRLRSRDRESQP